MLRTKNLINALELQTVRGDKRLHRRGAEHGEEGSKCARSRFSPLSSRRSLSVLSIAAVNPA